MVKQYPHTLKTYSPATATEDANGNFITTAPTSVERICRYEVSTGEGLIQAADGEMVKYAGTVYMPLGPSIAFGAEVEVWGLDDTDTLVLKAKGRVKRFDRGQLNQKIWL